jgi:PAS domain S-box-containing protein
MAKEGHEGAPPSAEPGASFEPDLICRYLPDATLTFANEAYCRYFGRSRADLIGRSFIELIPTVDRARVLDHLASFTLDRPAAEVEHRVTLPSGEIHWQHWTDHAFFDASGRLTEFHSVGRDVTDQKRAERALRESEERYRALVTASADVVWHTSADGNAHFVSPSWQQLTGQTHEQMKGFGWLDAVHPDDRSRTVAVWREALASVRAYEQEFRVRRRDGRYRYCLTRGVPILEDDGSVREWVGANTDITERREAEIALREGQERHRLATAAGAVGVWELDLETGEMYIDPELKALLGFEDHEIPNRLEDWLQRGYPPDMPRAQADIDAHVAGRTPQYENEHRMLHRDGSIRWFLARGRVVRAPGEHARLLGTDTDITGRKQAAEALHDVQARHQAMLRAIPDLIFVLDQHGVYLDYHAPDPVLLAAPPDELLGRNVRELFPPELADRFAQAIAEVVRTGDPVNVEYELAADDEVRQWEARIVPCDADRVLSIVRDRTEQKRAENETRQLRDELAHFGRVTSLGALTGSLAHEINQPLAAIMANAQAALRMLANGAPDPTELRETLADIVADDRRAGDVLQRLRALLTKGTPQSSFLDLTAILEEMLALVHSDTVMRRIALDVRLAPDLPAVRGDRVQLQQVALNLLLNAFEAVEGLETDRRTIVVEAARRDGFVTLSVVDEGPGVDPKDMARVFEPFFTTKRDGMGLGLAICQTIASAHGGVLVAAANVGRGMTFSLRLPVAADARGERSGPE